MDERIHHILGLCPNWEIIFRPRTSVEALHEATTLVVMTGRFSWGGPCRREGIRRMIRDEAWRVN